MSRMEYLLAIWRADQEKEVLSLFGSDKDETLDYAEFWIITNPDDIVMFVEIEVRTCRNCGLLIREKVGWVLHRWVHAGGNYVCTLKGLTQAMPEEDE